MRNVSQATQKNILGNSTNDVDYMYYVLMQSVKNCGSSRIHKLSETVQETNYVVNPIHSL